jgi:hypothetical protein
MEGCRSETLILNNGGNHNRRIDRDPPASI